MGEQMENEITVNSVEDVKFHLAKEKEKISEGIKLLVAELSELEQAYVSNDAALIAEKNKSVIEYLQNLESSGANIKTLAEYAP